jgi:hypothetical protein
VFIFTTLECSYSLYISVHTYFNRIFVFNIIRAESDFGAVVKIRFVNFLQYKFIFLFFKIYIIIKIFIKIFIKNS